MRIPKRLETVIDTGGLIVALVVDIVINVICFYTLSPDIISAVAFVSIGVMIVLFVFRSWSKGQVIPWIVFVLVVFFFDYSYALEITKVQSEKKAVNIYENQEVVNLDTAIAVNNETLTILRGQYDKAMKRETLEEINAQIENETTAKEENQKERKLLIQELKKKQKTESGITASAVFDAIPSAYREGRRLPLIVFGLIFLGLQMIVATSIENDLFKKKKPIEKKRVFEKEDFLRMFYYGVEIGKPFVPAENIMAKYCQIAGVPWDESAVTLYKECLEKMEKSGISDSGKKITGTAKAARAALFETPNE